MDPPDTPPALPPRMPVDRSRPSSLISSNLQEKCEVKPPVEDNAPKVSNKFHFRIRAKQLNSATGRIKGFAKSGLSVGEKFTFWLFNKLSAWSHKWFAHCFLTIILVLYTVGGALMFIAVEGSSEDVVEDSISKDTIVQHIQKARFDLMSELKNYSGVVLQNKSENEWNDVVTKQLEKYESFIAEAYQNISLTAMDSSPNMWTFFNAIVFCGTVYSTIGYGHMYPTTYSGMALTIVYAIIGIPLFLIALTDFGKLFTRGMKFLWSFVRRLYYTGSCRKARKKAYVQDIIQSAQMVYGLALIGKRAIFSENNENADVEKASKSDNTKKTKSTFEVDDEFNLPISVAISVLLLYIFSGAVMYCIWEGWDFFGSFYFVFISLSTIGFGDYVPKNPFCMIISVAYLIFGLALMSMCINVVQVELNDKFSRASAKLSETINLGANEDDHGTFTIVEPTSILQTDVENKDKENITTSKKSENIISSSKDENADEIKTYL